MKKKYIVSFFSAALAVAFFVMGHRYLFVTRSEPLKVGYLYIGDESNAYSYNFIRTQHDIEAEYKTNVESVVRCNVPEDDAEQAIEGMIEEGCRLIFGTSYGYQNAMKAAAKEHPQVQFCQATGDNSGDAPILVNYHTFMGRIYEGRYLSGAVCGMKLQELIEAGTVSADAAKVGYVAAFPYPEVISGYTAFLLGVRAYCPTAELYVRYTNSWGDYRAEKEAAEKLIAEGCVILSQHSDTFGPAVACEDTGSDCVIYSASFNRSAIDVAPTTSLIGCRINWTPYMMEAVGAVLQERRIENGFGRGVRINGTDAGAGFDHGWVEMLELNPVIAAKGTQEELEHLKSQFRHGKLKVFHGDYTGTDPQDPEDKIDLHTTYPENKKASAPSFHYLLDDIVHIKARQ